MEKKEIVKRYVEKQQLSLPILLDTEGKVANTYSVRAHPDHFLVDRGGEFIGKTVGARDWQSVENRNLIQYLLERDEKE